MVNDDKLRFDFTYNEQLSNEQVNRIESLVNQSIRANIESKTELLPTKKAIETGAIALFGERYPEKVRVISFVNSISESLLSSVELCGGTHVSFTGQIGMFKIISDNSVSSGVKRIEAVTGESAENYFFEQAKLINQIKDKLKVNKNNLIEKIDNLKKELASLKKDVSNKKLQISEDNLIISDKFKCYYNELDIDQKELKNLSDSIKKEIDANIVILITKYNNKISVVVSVSEEINQVTNAIDILKKIVVFLGGKGGGGRRDMAQGGAPISDKIQN